jgi:hypothetical protein
LLALFGLAARTFHFVRNPSMWHDEAVLVLNVLHKDFTGCWGKLDFAEAAPPLFLVLEKLAVLVLGDGTYALRLLPYLASCVALLLFVRIAARILSGAAVPWAVLLFACSDHLLWHASEAKPYSTDVLCAVMLLCALVASERWSLATRSWLLAAAAPVVIFLSFPGVFLVGGVLAALLPNFLQRSRGWSDRFAYLSLVAITVLSFGVLVTGPVRAQRCPQLHECWIECFAPLDDPTFLPAWIAHNTVQICRYCLEPTGNVLFLAVAFGACQMAKHRPALLTFLLLPCGLALVASSFQAYPYTAARVLVYTTPAWALLIGEGTAWAIGELQRFRRNTISAWSRGGAIAAGGGLVILLLMSPAYVMMHAFNPQPRTQCSRAARFVLEHAEPADVITSNAPESRYYLRGIRAFVAPDALESVTTDRIWLVGTGRTEKERLVCTHLLPPGDWQITRQRDYVLTTIYRLERKP